MSLSWSGGQTMLEEELLTLQIFLEGDLVNVYPLIRTRYIFQNRGMSFPKISEEETCVTSIIISIVLRVKKGTPSRLAFSIAPKNSERWLLKADSSTSDLSMICILTSPLKIVALHSILCLPYRTWSCVLLFIFPLNVSGFKKKKKSQKGNLANILPVSNENKTRKTVPW